MADADKIDLQIITPDGAPLSVQVDEVTAPSVNGEFGVLPGHLPLLAALRTGLVSYRAGGETKRCAVGPGFAEAGASKLLILTDHYIEREQVDPVLVRKELQEVQGELAEVENSANDDDDRRQLETLIKKENWLAAQLELYGDPPPATMRPYEQYGPPPPPDESEVPVSDKPDAGTRTPGKTGTSDDASDAAS